MTEKKGRPVSRRDLFGLFGRPVRTLKDSLERAAPILAPGAKPPAPPQSAAQPSSSAPWVTKLRKLRPAWETATTLLEEPGIWGVDLRRRPLGVGRSLRVFGDGLAEPFVLVRVSETHFAACGGECPVDGSDLLWIADADRLGCPSCGSRWRLDGALTRGPADCSTASFTVEDRRGIIRIRTG